MESKRIDNILEKVGKTPDKLIEVLLAVQAKSKYNYISKESLKYIAKELNIPISKAYGVASFYSMLSTKKRGKYVIQICNSAPCYLCGGREITQFLKNYLKININEVTEDGLFSLEFTSCIGACNKAPAIKINDQLHVNLTNEKVIDLISSIRMGEE